MAPAGLTLDEEADVRAERSNENVADRLDEVADVLEALRANPYRVRAYRRGAATVRSLRTPVGELFDGQGEAGLRLLPGIGPSLARSIGLLVRIGRLPMLERLRSAGSPGAQLRSIPGVGRRWAERLHGLGIDTLEQLEAAAHDGRLAALGFGRKRLAGVRDSLAQRLRRVDDAGPPAETPSVHELLDVDREYREKAAARDLPAIAPRRFNPGRSAWLPVLRTSRGPRRYTALFSNSARAHRRGRTNDWVVIVYEDALGRTGRATVVTERRGPEAGRRTVRGREAECARSQPAA
jgi:predicted flap endonuclease-1-like 5' DNA nuclease